MAASQRDTVRFCIVSVSGLFGLQARRLGPVQVNGASLAVGNVLAYTRSVYLVHWRMSEETSHATEMRGAVLHSRA